MQSCDDTDTRVVRSDEAVPLEAKINVRKDDFFSGPSFLHHLTAKLSFTIVAIHMMLFKSSVFVVEVGDTGEVRRNRALPPFR